MKCTIAVGALAAVAAAAPEKIVKRQSAFNTGSAVQVLETALPSSLLSEFITNSGGAASMVASQFSAGATPSWFSGLPSDIQTYLVPANPSAAGGLSSAASAAAASVTAAGIAPTPRPSLGYSMPYGVNGTTAGVAGMGTAGSGAAGASRTSMSGMSGSSSGMGSMSTGSGSGSSGSGGSGNSGSGSGAGGSGSSTAGGAPAPTAAVFGMGLAGVAAVAGLVVL